MHLLTLRCLQVLHFTFESAVVKSRIQARHDGKVLNGPLEHSNICDQFSYQKLIDNSHGDFVVDYRPVIVGNDIPFVYVKCRPIETRFTNLNSKVYIVSPRCVFTLQEINLILNFCKKMNMVFGEVDVLRDNADMKIYIVDANNTPNGPPNGLTKDEASIAIKLLSNSMLDFFGY